MDNLDQFLEGEDSWEDFQAAIAEVSPTLPPAVPPHPPSYTAPVSTAAPEVSPPPPAGPPAVAPPPGAPAVPVAPEVSPPDLLDTFLEGDMPWEKLREPVAEPVKEPAPFEPKVIKPGVTVGAWPEPKMEPLYEELALPVPSERISPEEAFKTYNIMGGIEDIGKFAYDIPINLIGATASLFEDDNPEAEYDWKDISRRAQEDRNKMRIAEPGAEEYVLPWVQRKDIRQAAASAGFSGVAMTSAVLAGAAAIPIPVPGTTPAAAMAGAGTTAYKMDKAMFTQQIIDAARINNPNITPEEVAKLVEDTKDIRMKHALWEAIPEAIGNAAQLTGIGMLFKAALGKKLGAKIFQTLVGMYGAEISTEVVTQMSQHNTEIEAGLAAGEKRSFTSLEDLKESLKEVGPQTFVLVTLTGGFGAGAAKTYQLATAKVKGAEKIKVEPPVTEVAPPDEAPPVAPPVDEVRAKFEAGEFTGEDLEAIKEIWSDEAEFVSAIDEIAKPVVEEAAVVKAASEPEMRAELLAKMKKERPDITDEAAAKMVDDAIKRTEEFMPTKEKPTEEAALPLEERRLDFKTREQFEELLKQTETIEEARELAQKMSQKAYTDPLMGIKNKTAWIEYKEMEAGLPDEKKRYKAVFDIDNFSWYNDVAGHAAGDKILKEVGKILKAEGTDPYRFGGEEMLDLNSSREALSLTAGRIRDRLANEIKLEFKVGERVELADGTIYEPGEKLKFEGIGISYGIDKDFKKADQALTRDKQKRTKAGIRVEKGREPKAVVRIPERIPEARKGVPREVRPPEKPTEKIPPRPPEVPGKPPVEAKERIPKERKLKPAKESKVRTLRGRIIEMGKINFLNYKGEVKGMPAAVRYLSKKSGVSIDNAVNQLISDGWLYEGETVASFLEDLRTKPELLKRDRITRGIEEKAEYELSPQEKRLKKEMEWEPEGPPEGTYVQIRAEDLPEGAELTIIEGKSREGWDRYKVTAKDPFSITLLDGEEIELKPLDEVEVLKKELPEAEVKPPVKPITPAEFSMAATAEAKVIPESEKIATSPIRAPVGDSHALPFEEGPPNKEKVATLKKWLSKHGDKYKNEYVTLYHGTGVGVPVLEEGLKPTSATRRRSYQATSGYVYLAPTYERAKVFGDLANMGRSRIYAVQVPVGKLLVDKDQLTNQRAVGVKVGNTVAESIIYGGSARVRGKIGLWQIKEVKPEGVEVEELISEEILYSTAAKTKADLFRSYGVKVVGGKVVLYRGGDVSKKILSDLRYGDHLSAVESGFDATGNEGAASYGKNVVRFELPIEDVEATGAGEFQYKGRAKSLEGGTKYPQAIYRAYNDYFGANFTAKEIDLMDEAEVRSTASMALSGGREEFDRLMRDAGAQTLYSAVVEAKASTSTKKVIDTIIPILKTWANFPATRVVQAVGELPRRLRGQATAQERKTKGKVEGLYDPETDQVYLIAGNLSESRIEDVLRHEGEGHRGLRLLMGSGMDSFLDKVVDAKKAELLKMVPGLNLKDKTSARNAANEWSARQIEAGTMKPLWYGRLVYAFKQWLRKFIPSLKLSDADIKVILHDVVMNVREGAPQALREQKEITALASEKVAKWHSHMSNVLKQKLPGKGTPESYAQTIEGFARKGEFKAEELEWSGIMDWLKEQKGKISKQGVLDYLVVNNVRVEEVVKGKLGRRWKEEEKGTWSYGPSYGVFLNEDGTYDANAVDGRGLVIWSQNYDTLDDAKEAVEYDYREEISSGQPSDIVTDETKFGEYVLPGGERYRELLLTFPIKEAGRSEERIKEDLNRELGLPLRGPLPNREVALSKAETTEQRNRLLTLYDELDAYYDRPHILSAPYQTSHWDEPNVLAHIRFDERTGPKGEKILHIAEIQSDWHQEGRKKGYRLSEVERKQDLAEYNKIKEEIDSVLDQFPISNKRPKSEKDRLGKLGDELNRIDDKYGGDIERPHAIESIMYGGKPPVPRVPFKKTWPLLTIKRMVRYAASNGFDMISWDIGEVQAERYDLSKQLNTVYYLDEGNGKYSLAARAKNDEVVINRSGLSEQELEDTIGKELAEKIVAGKGKIVTGGGPFNNWNRFEGLDLKVGGEGMKSFYDKLLPNVVNKFFNKAVWGKAKVETIGIETIQKAEKSLVLGVTIGVDKPIVSKAHSLPITPEMKTKAIHEGMPLFSVKRELTDKQRTFLEKHYPEKLEALDKKLKSKSGGNILEESRKDFGNFAEMGEIPSQPEGFNMPHEGKGRQVFDLLQFKIQDRFNSLRRVQEVVEKTIATEIPEAANAYQTEELYHGKVAERMGAFDSEHIDPLVEMIHESEFELEDIEEYLYARHAPEANKHLEKINPKRKDNKALSGLTTSDAIAVLSKYSGNKTMEKIAAKVDAITKGTRGILVKDGLATAKEIAAWEGAYKYYVPLKRDMKDAGLPKRGAGVNIIGPESKRRLTGSAERQAANILANIVAQHEATIIRAEKAKVGRAMLKLAEAHPNKELWEVDAKELKPFLKQRKSEEVDETTGLPQTLNEVVFGRDILYKFSDNVLVVKVDGVERTITFNKDNVHAQRIVRSLKNLGAADMSAVIKTLSTVNRWLAIVNTSANPEFIISNFTRDIQTAGYNINDTQAKNMKVKVFKDVFRALQGIRRGIRGDFTSEWAKNYQDFVKAGAQTGWTDHYKNIEDREKSLKKKLNLMKDGTWRSMQRGAKGLFEFISNENTAVENAIRLSIYTHLKKAGASDAVAASAAKNLTVNFNRRGDMGQTLNAMYLFFNANVQGSARLIYAAARSPGVRKMMYGTVAFAVMLDIANRAIGGEDDDGENRYDKVPHWVKEHNLVLMRPNGDYFKLPLPWGYNTLHVLGQSIGEAVDPNADKFDAMAAAGRLGSAILGSFNPLGSESTLLQLAAPTIADPFVQWAENKNFAGIPIKPEQMPFDVSKPEYQLYFQSARKPSRWVAKMLSDLTGGDEVRPGLVDVSPEVFDLFLDTVVGGAGKFIDNTLSLPAELARKDPEIRKVPFVKKVYGEAPDYYIRTKFYDNLSEVRYAQKSVDHYEDDKDKAASTKRKYSWEIRFINRAKRDKKKIGDLRKKRNRIQKGDESERIKESKIEDIEKQIAQIMTDFNRTYKKKAGGTYMAMPSPRTTGYVPRKPLTLREAMQAK